MAQLKSKIVAFNCEHWKLFSKHRNSSDRNEPEFDNQYNMGPFIIEEIPPENEQPRIREINESIPNYPRQQLNSRFLKDFGIRGHRALRPSNGGSEFNAGVSASWATIVREEGRKEHGIQEMPRTWPLPLQILINALWKGIQVPMTTARKTRS
ncbi:hypothetical protein B0H19DRAFT_1084519 [Mycena capillaripes]|nr:hypothetical protein B0H19DRAFT_1084519 [Mycena capillaripes]